MTKVVTAKEMRALDHHTINEVGIPALVLMERAALAITDHILALPKEKRHQVVIVVGNGNNGGDGLAVARLLHLAGTPVKLLFVMPPAQASEENRVQQHTCAYYQIPATTDLATLKDATLIVDAIFGIGIDREVTGHYREVIEAINQAPAPVVAVDIPSGLNTDTGETMGVAVKAASTVTLAYPKIGLTTPDGEEFAGRIVIADKVGIYDI